MSSKKKSTVPVVTKVSDIPVEGKVESNLDLKLSKNDLIEMVVEEAREEAQKKVNKLQPEHSKAYNELKEYDKNRESRLNQVVLNRADDLVKVMVKRGYNKIECSPYGNKQFTSLNKEGHSFTYHEQFEVEIRSSTRNDKEDFYSSFKVHLTEKDYKVLAEEDTIARNKYKTINDAMYKAQKELSDVDNMGKKTKAQLVKRILEGSDEGKAILENMQSVKENMMLQITAKKVDE